MRKLILLVFFVLLCWTSHAQKNAIFFAPHADDESLAMGDAIASAIAEGYNTIVVVLTNGKDVGSVQQYTLSKEDIIKARKRELIIAAEILGVEEENIIFENYDDDKLTVSQCLKTIDKVNHLYPNAKMSTVSVYDTHPDHQAIARALYQSYLNLDKKISIAFYRVYLHADLKTIDKLPRSVEAIPLKYPEIRRKAITSYKDYDPIKGVYGIGYDAEPELFKAALESNYEYRDQLSSKTILLLKNERSTLIIIPALIAGGLLLLSYLFRLVIKQRR
jgi:hypothetical protein